MRGEAAAQEEGGLIKFCIHTVRFCDLQCVHLGPINILYISD